MPETTPFPTTWTDEDDALVRAALRSLREDVDALDAPEPVTVRQSGDGRRRRRYVAWSALGAAAAAAAVVAAVGLGALGGRPGASTLPGGSATGSSTTSATTSPTPSAEPTLTASPLPIAEEWSGLLGRPGTWAVLTQPAHDTLGGVCSLTPGGTLGDDQRVVTDRANPDATAVGTQTWWAFRDEAAAVAATTKVLAQVKACTTAPGLEEVSTPGDARAWRFTVDGLTGWFALAQSGHSVSYLELMPQDWVLPEGGFAALADRAQARLVQNGGLVPAPTVSDTAGTSTVPSNVPTNVSPPPPTSGGATASEAAAAASALLLGMTSGDMDIVGNAALQPVLDTIAQAQQANPGARWHDAGTCTPSGLPLGCSVTVALDRPGTSGGPALIYHLTFARDADGQVRVATMTSGGDAG